MTIRCICVDDEALARQGLKIALQPYTDFELVGEYGNVEQVLQVDHRGIDVMFIDIEMPRLDGFELVKRWHGNLPIIVFITAYDRFALKAFEHQALDYVLKPINEERFAQVIQRIRTTRDYENYRIKADKLVKILEELKTGSNEAPDAISIKTTEGYFRIKLTDILYFEAVGDHVCLHLPDQQLITRNTLKKYIAELSEKGFSQIHKSFLVNTAHIQSVTRLQFGDHQITLSNNAVLRMSRRFRGGILENFSG